MTVQDITTIISTVGFPIVMCLLMAWYFYKRDQTMTDALSNLTVAVNKLCAKIGGEEEEGNDESY